MDYLLNQTVLAALGVLFGLAGIVVSIVVTMRSRIRIEPCVFYENIREVSKLSDSNRQIAVHYKDQTVNQVTTTRVWLWNRGKKPLRREDIPPNDRLRISLRDRESKDSEITVLDFGVVKVSKGSSNFSLKPLGKPNAIQLEFDYLDSGDGAVFEIQHTGSHRAAPDLEGVILGPKRKTRILSGYSSATEGLNRKERRRRLLRRVLPFVAASVLMPIILNALSFYIPAEIRSEQRSFRKTFPQILNENGVDPQKALVITEQVVIKYQKKEPVFAMSAIMLGTVMIVLGLLYFAEYRRRYPKGLKTD